jgi:hypothetical protein
MMDGLNRKRTKLKAYPSNPAHDCVFNPLYENVYDKQPNTIQPFGLRVNTHFRSFNDIFGLLYRPVSTANGLSATSKIDEIRLCCY